MVLRSLVLIVLLAASLAAHAYSFIYGYEEAPSIAQALERLKSQPNKHVLIYFGMPKGCPPCNYTRTILSSGDLLARWKPNYIVVNVDIFSPTAEERVVIDKYRVTWAPVLAFLDGSGKRVAYARQLRNEKEALLLNEFVSQKLYLKTDYKQYYAANFDSKSAERVVPVTRVAAVSRIDDRPRLRDVLAQKNERVSGEQLKNAIAGKRMQKENQDWFLTMDLAPAGMVAASGRRKDGKARMQGPGKWYVTKKGKLCIEVKATNLDESWCRHVYSVGDNYYYAVKDQREKSLAYRFALETI